jgi:hypothetical protein
MRKPANRFLSFIVLAIVAAIMPINAAPPPAESPVHLDVDGISPGMPAQEAYNLLKARNPRIRIGVGQNQVQVVSDKPIPLTMAAEVMDPAAPEVITLWLTTPPRPQVVWAIGRVLEYDPKQPLSKDNVLASLRQKFGQEIQTMGPTTFWAFDEHGARANEATMRNLNCMNVSRWNLTVAAPQGPSFPAITPIICSPPVQLTPCDAVVEVKATLLGPGTTPYVNRIVVLMSDLPLAYGSQRAYQAYLAHAGDAKAREEREKAKQRTAPKF